MRLLVTGAWKAAEEQLQAIRSLGHDVVFQQQETEPLVCSYEEVEGVICNALFLSHPIEKFTNLHYIQLTSAGLDRVPMDYVNAHGIEIHNARGVYSAPMAEHAIAGVLTLFRRLHDFHDLQKERKWQKIRDLEELNGKTVLILGCGSVGTECAKRFKAFNCSVIGVDIAVRQDKNYNIMLPLAKLDGLLATADVIVLTLPLTEDTRGLFCEQRFSLLNPDAVLVNIARGPVVEINALMRHIDLIGGAVLDVFEEEPLSSGSPLWDKPNVVLTPHISYVGDGVSERLAALILANLEQNARRRN